MSNKIDRLKLPFTVLAENRKELFTKKMEKAAIYCFTELERVKGGGLILKKPEEKTVFLAEFHYPFWVAPWNGLNLVFDGLKQVSHTITYKGIPGFREFFENASRSSKSMEAYMAFLSDHVNFFQAPAEEKALVLDALVVDSVFLGEFAQCLSEAKPLEAEEAREAFITPHVDELAVSSVTEELERLKVDFEAEAAVLNSCIKLLNRTTRGFVKDIRGKIKSVREEFEAEIRKHEEAVAQKISRLNEEYEEQRVKLMKDFEKQLMPLQKEKLKLEKMRDQIARKIEQYNLEAKSCAASSDSAGEKRWKEKANEARRELSEIERKIEEAEDRIRELEESREAESFRLRSEWETRIKEARKDLLELEASRDAKIQVYQDEMARLESLTSKIIQQINSVVKMREADLAGFNNLGIQQKCENLSLLYVPFYMACFEAELKKRYVVFSPSAVNSIGFTTKLKGALGKAKVKHLLTPRFRAVSSLLEKLPALIEKDAAFAREVYEAGEKANMLKSEATLEAIGEGLKRLKDEGWLSDKEFEAFSQKFA
ncbi:hypothetical protein KEJ24_08880 [Candidatus Bathyarchaeota archaeon]|nr:hypothetical protein [Candidatus Bathyarchaeota archaeon]